MPAPVPSPRQQPTIRVARIAETDRAWRLLSGYLETPRPEVYSVYRGRRVHHHQRATNRATATWIRKKLRSNCQTVGNWCDPVLRGSSWFECGGHAGAHRHPARPGAVV